MFGSCSSTESASGSASSWSYVLSMSVMIRAVFGIRRPKVAASLRAEEGLPRLAAVRPMQGGAAESECFQVDVLARVQDTGAARIVATEGLAVTPRGLVGDG